MVKIKFNEIPIEIDESHPVGRLIFKELSLLPITDDEPKIRFTFTHSEISPKDKGVYIANNPGIIKSLFICDNSVYMKVVRSLGKDFYDLLVKREDSGPFEVLISIKYKPTNFLVDFANKFLSWDHSSIYEQGAYSIMNIIEVFMLLLLSEERTLLHSSSIVDKNRNATLFVGSSGAGKTSMCIGLVNAGKGLFLSEDMSLIGRDGMITLNPRYLRVYPYVTTYNRNLYDKVMRNKSLLDRLHWHVMGTIRGKRQVRRLVPPNYVLGDDKVGETGRIKNIVYLQRTSDTDFKLISADQPTLIYKCANNTFIDFGYYLTTVRLINSTYFNSVFPNVEKIIERSKNIYLEAFAHADCYWLFIPLEATSQQITTFIIDNLLER